MNKDNGGWESRASTNQHHYQPLSPPSNLNGLFTPGDDCGLVYQPPQSTHRRSRVWLVFEFFPKLFQLHLLPLLNIHPHQHNSSNPSLQTSFYCKQNNLYSFLTLNSVKLVTSSPNCSMASKVDKSHRKNLIKNFYKSSKGSKVSAMALNDSVAGAAMLAVDADFASGYPSEVSKEWYSKLDNDQDKSKSIQSKILTFANSCEWLSVMKLLVSTLIASPQQRTLATPTKPSTVTPSTSHCLPFPNPISSISSQMQTRSPAPPSERPAPTSPPSPLLATLTLIPSSATPMASLSLVVQPARTATALMTSATRVMMQTVVSPLIPAHFAGLTL